MPAPVYDGCAMALPAHAGRLWLDAQERALSHLAGVGGPTPAPHLETGLQGERAALFELRRRGIVVVARRWTSPRRRGDLDLIGWDGGTLCFFEIKTRMVRDMTPAESAVDEHKREIMRGLARAYLRTFPEAERTRIPVRFDVVSVYGVGGRTEFDHFPSAFGWR